MRRTWVLVLALAAGASMPLMAQVPYRGPRFPTTVRDAKTPYVILLAPADPSSGSFSVGVQTADPSGITSVSISVEGTVVATRTRPPFSFNLEVSTLPAEICALAVDLAGNSAMDCELVGSEGTCVLDADCTGAMQYCARPFGNCSGRGRCTPRPDDCRYSTGPVCGCDGKTYETECRAAVASANVVHSGVCARDSCAEDTDCARDQICQKLPGNCGSRGFCATRPLGPCNCPLSVFELVCGCDGKTHDICQAACRKIPIAHVGACRHSE